MISMATCIRRIQGVAAINTYRITKKAASVMLAAFRIII